jgi:hypothetical protein
MNFWNEHSVMFIVAMVVMPRMMLIYYGMITPLQVPPILGLIFCPRIFMMGILTTAYNGQNPTLIVILWILAVILDIIGFIVKSAMGVQMQKTAMEQYMSQSRGF